MIFSLRCVGVSVFVVVFFSDRFSTSICEYVFVHMYDCRHHLCCRCWYCSSISFLLPPPRTLFQPWSVRKASKIFVCLFVSPLFHSSSIGCTFWERFCCSCWCCCCFAPLAIKFRHRIVFVFVVIVIRFSVIVASSIFHTNLILNPKRHIHGNAAMVHRFPFYHTMTVPAERSERKERNETKRNGTAWIQRRLQTNTKTHRHTVTGIVTGVQLFFDFSQCWFHLISVRFCVCVITLFCTLNFIEK